MSRVGILVGREKTFPDALINPEKNAFSPRVGLAWRPTSKGHLLVRSGYGMFYNGSIYNQFASRLASQPPFASTTTLTTTMTHRRRIDHARHAA